MRMVAFKRGEGEGSSEVVVGEAEIFKLVNSSTKAWRRGWIRVIQWCECLNNLGEKANGTKGDAG